ncbi:MAG TPA: hypothetical protein VK717_00085 [Opitutaceae bacterium]|jgi:alpha-L-fucosidase 2|nr:hypothetical protein [Opitutaceae bacterium]
MNHPTRAFIALKLFAAFVFAALLTARAEPAPPIDWPAFLAREDLVWTKVPAVWEEAPFIGNGNLGAAIFTQAGALAWEINRTDVYHADSRYPIGRVALHTAGAVTGGDLRLDLWNAEARGTLRTDRGEVRWRSFTATQPSVIALELEGTKDERDVDVTWIPALARPPRSVHSKLPFGPEDLHPPQTVHTTGDGLTSTERFIGGGAFAVVLKHVPGIGGKKIIYVSIGRGETEEAALADANAAMDQAFALGPAKLTEGHRAWWHAFYPASFLSIPDARLEAFYWIQIYKLGSAMRPDGPILDLMGPWFHDTPWPRIWWNLNAQLTYSPLFTANRLPLAESLFGALDRHRQQLIDNVPPSLRPEAAAIGRTSDQALSSPVNLATAKGDSGHEIGNLPWVMFLYWEYYRYQMDDTILRDRVLPLLSRTVGHYLAYVEKDADGHYHLPPTFSPELALVPDCNYDLALLRWGLQTLIASCEHLHLDDPHLPRWREVLANLTPFPADANGLMVGRDRPLRESHRHYSHLLAIYPLHLLTPDVSADRALIEASLHNWDSREEKFRGFSYTGAASMYALLGDGDTALDRLHRLLDRVIKPNTLYTEAGPVIETPLSAATSLQEMLLQSWGGKLRVFPAIPAAWQDVAFGTLRAEGAFLVSAVRHDGQTAWVRIESLAGAPCRIIMPGWKDAVIRADSPGEKTAIAREADGGFALSLPKGAWVVLAPSTDAPLPGLAPVETPAAAQNPYPMHYK